MTQDLLIPNYDEEYDDIPYDLIYTSSTNIPTKNDLIGTNPTVSTESCSNETFLCMTGFYNSSKYFFLFLFLMLSFMTGILYLITIINTPK
jgi:hypothetical protein